MHTSYPCPRCGVTASLDDGCPGCGAAPDPDAAEVIRLNAEITELTGRLNNARAQVIALERTLYDTRAVRDRTAARIVAARVPTPVHASAVPAVPGEPRLSPLTVQNVLFALGGLLLVVAAAVFTAVAWAQVGVTGRALLLAAATTAVLAVPPFAARRGLTAAAETLAAVGLLMLLLDGWAAWAVGLEWVRLLDARGYAAAVLAATAVLAAGYSVVTRLRGPWIMALLVAQPVLPLLAAAGQAGPVRWSLAFTVTAALDVVALQFRADPVRSDPVRSDPGRADPVRADPPTRGFGRLASGCAAVMGSVGALLALQHLVRAGRPGSAAVAGLVLLLPFVLLSIRASIAGRRLAQSIAAGLLVVVTGLAGARWLWTLPLDFHGSGWWASRLAMVALVLAVVIAPLSRSTPFGAWLGALLVAAAPAATVLVAAGVGAVHSVIAARPVFAAPLSRDTGGPGMDHLVAAVLTASAYALLLPRRTRTNLALTALAVTGLLVPSAAGLPWWAAAVAGLVVAGVALGLTVRAAATYRVVFCLAGVLYAVIVGCGDRVVLATVFGVITVTGTGTALALRHTPRSTVLGAAAAAAGLLSSPVTVWLVLFAADVPVTWRVRITLAVAALLCLAAHLVHRRLPVYRSSAVGAALVVLGFAPVWAAPGTDPLVLYPAAALLLIVSLLPVPGTGTVAGVVAALLPGLALLAFTAGDLAVVLVEPWTALRTIWSQSPPPQSPIAWSGVAALALAAVAASGGSLQINRLAAAGAAAPFVAVLVPLILAAAGAPWPAVPIAGSVTGLGGLLAITLLPARHPMSVLAAMLFGALAAAGLAGSAAGHGATVAGFVLVLATGLAVGVLGRVRSDRIGGWSAGSVAVVVVAYTVADLVGLGVAGPPLFVLAAAAVVIGLEWMLAGRRPAEASAPLLVGHASALVAVLLSESLLWAAVVCKLWALVLTVRALRPGETRRFGYRIAAGAVALAGWWLLLASQEVATAEIYTLPAALLALAAGWFARRDRPQLSSWSAYGAALAAAFLPTLAVVADSGAGDPQYQRRLLLGIGALLVLVAGARTRLRAPVLTGGGTLVLVALHELIQFWDLVPRWVPLAAGGLLLVGVATTMEQRRQDLARLRAAVAGMT